MAQTQEQTRESIFFGWFIVFASLAVTTTAFGTLYSFGVFFKGWIEEWHCTRALLSGVFSLGFLIYGISSFFMGNLTDRYGPRKTLAIGGFIMGGGTFLTSLAPHAWVLYLTFSAMVGIGVGTSYSPTATTVSRWFVQKKGLAVGTVVSGLGLGTLILPPLARYIIGSWGWRAAFVVFGIIIWTVYFTAASILRRDPRDMGLQPYGQGSAGRPGAGPQAAPGAAGEVIHTGDALRMSRFWILFFVHSFWVVGMATPMVHFVPHATDVGVPPAQASFMLAVLGGVSVLGRVFLGALAEKMGTRRSLLFLLSFQMMTMLWLTVSTNAWMCWAFAIFFGLSYGGLASVFPLATAEYFGLASMGSIFGLILLGATLGGVTGPWIVGYLFDLTQKYFFGFLVCAASNGLGVLLALQLPRLGMKSARVAAVGQK